MQHATTEQLIDFLVKTPEDLHPEQVRCILLNLLRRLVTVQ
jgi:hypothetical protein